MTLAEAFDTLREFHKKAPFLFFNGNTFAAIGVLEDGRIVWRTDGGTELVGCRRH